MKHLTTTLILTLLLFNCVDKQKQKKRTEEVQQEPTAFIKNIEAQEFKQLVDAGKGIVLDVRTPEEVAQGHIKNASTVNFYDEDFQEKINLITKDKPIYVYCKAGGRSSKASKMLQQNGFDRVYNLNNGFMAWEDSGFSIEKTATTKDNNIKEFTLTDFKDLLKTDTPVLIDFHTVWCAPCKKMAPVVDKIEEEYAQKAVVKRIDVDNSKAVAKAYDIKGVPVFVLFKNGEIKWRHTGMVSEEELKAQIEKVM